MVTVTYLFPFFRVGVACRFRHLIHVSGIYSKKYLSTVNLRNGEFQAVSE